MILDIIFTINTVLPVFITILVGFIIKKKKIISELGAKELNNLVFKVLLPLLLFGNIAFADFSELFDLKFVLYTVFITIATFFLCLLYGRFFIKDKTLIGTFVQGAFRGNYALLSLALIDNVLGDVSFARASMIGPFVMPVYNVFSVIVLSVMSKNASNLDKESLKKIFFNVLKNPIIISVMLALPFSILSIKLPLVMENSIKYIGASASPIALISVGASFNFASIKKNKKESIVATLIKLVISPLTAVYFGYLIGFRNADLIIIGLVIGSPTAVSSYVMATSLDGDPDLAANILVLTTLFSVVTLTGMIAIAKIIGII